MSYYIGSDNLNIGAGQYLHGNSCFTENWIENTSLSWSTDRFAGSQGPKFQSFIQALAPPFHPQVCFFINPQRGALCILKEVSVSSYCGSKDFGISDIASSYTRALLLTNRLWNNTIFYQWNNFWIKINSYKYTIFLFIILMEIDLPLLDVGICFPWNSYGNIIYHLSGVG